MMILDNRHFIYKSVEVQLVVLEPDVGLVFDFIINHESKPQCYVDVRNRFGVLSGIENVKCFKKGLS